SVPLCLCLLGQSADDIVGLIPIQCDERNIESFNQFIDIRNSGGQVFRNRLAVGFVSFELGMSVGGCHGVEYDGDMRWLLRSQQFQKRIGKTEYRGCVESG